MIGFGLNIGNRVINTGGGGLNPDAQAFITATGITNPTEISAINTLVNDLQGYGLWTKMKAIYPFVGGTSTTCKYNLKDPRDLDAAFRLVFNGGWTFASTGAKGNGINNYANTYFANSNFNNYNSTSIFYYGNVGTNTGSWDIGNINATPNSRITAPPSDTNLYFQFNSANVNSFTLSPRNGLFGMSRISNTQVNAFYNNSKLGTVNETSISNANTNTFVIGSQFSNGSSNNSDRLFKFTSFGDGLTDTEASNLYSAVQQFNTTLSRQV